MKKNKGITIIALAVTIIVLLILAGISINLTLGENGIITKAKLAKESYLNAQEAEEQDLASLSNELAVSSSDSQNSEQTGNSQSSEELKELLKQQMEKTEQLEQKLQEMDELQKQENESKQQQIQKLQSDIAKLNEDTIKFPNYNKLLKEMTSFGESWTATEDCIITGYASTTGSATAWVSVDNIIIGGIYAFPKGVEHTEHGYICAYVKKGSVIKTRDTNDGSEGYVSFDLRIYALNTI